MFIFRYHFINHIRHHVCVTASILFDRNSFHINLPNLTQMLSVLFILSVTDFYRFELSLPRIALVMRTSVKSVRKALTWSMRCQCTERRCIQDVLKLSTGRNKVFVTTCQSCCIGRLDY